MNITDILNNIPEKSNNSISEKMNKAKQLRRIERRIEDFVSEVLDFVSCEYNSLNSAQPAPYFASERLSEEDKKELTNVLLTKVKALPDRIRAELDKYLKDSEETDNKDNKEVSAEITVATVPEAPKPIFNY
jgi:lipopolysaccharide biosynthesis regulator YciM